jgi:hypothetical protein
MGFFVFDEDNGSLKSSADTWIYPAVVVPLTISVFAIWFAWVKLRPNRVQKEIQELGLSIKRRDTVQVAKNEP